MRTMIALAVIFFAIAAQAQSLPNNSGDPLQDICSGFLEQNNLKVSGSAAKLCTCLVREVKGKLSRTEMETYDKLNASAKPLPTALQNKISGIAVQCLTEAQ
jgi:hypothetical protein